MFFRFMLRLYYSMYKCIVLFMIGNGGIYVVKLNVFKIYELFRFFDFIGY